MKRKNYISILLVLMILLSSFQLGLAVGLDSPTQYDINISLNTKEHTVEGEQYVSFINNYNGDLKELVFHLYPNSYNSYETLPVIGGLFYMEDEQMPKLAEEEKGYIKIQKIHIDDKEVEYTDDNQVLKIKLKEPLKKGKKANIKIKYLVKVPKGNHRFHHVDGTYSLTNWYPILSVYDEKTKRWDENPYNLIGESNYSHVSNYNVKLTVPKNMVVAPTGSIIDEKITGEDKILAIKAEKVRDFVILMSSDYEVKTKEVDGIKISNYYFKNENKNKCADMVLDEVVKTVKFMNRTVGKYPYEELRIVETYLGGGAMEYPQVLQMGRYFDLEGVDIKEQAPFSIESAVHETMHQWWYVGVGNDEFNEPFLDESLTTYAAAYYFEKEYGKYHENGVAYAIRNGIYPSNTMPLNSGVDEFVEWVDYGEVIYRRGPAFFEDLRQRVGEEKFIKILQNYYERYLFKNATIDNLLNIIEEVAGKEIRKTMEEATTKPNYFPKNIQLNEEERAYFFKKEEKRHLKMMEEENGLIIGSIILRLIEGEDVVIVKPENIRDENKEQIDNFISMITGSLKFSYGIEDEIKIIDESKLTEEDKKGNLIIIGYPKKNSLIKEIAPKLPLRLDKVNIDIKGLSIKNENVSGSFIAENPNNPKKLVLVSFLGENIATQRRLETSEGEIIVVEDTMYKYDPLFNSDYQFIINTEDIEIKGMYK